MKNQALFSSKDKRKKLKCRLLHFLFGALRANFTLHLLLKLNAGPCFRGIFGDLMTRSSSNVP